ncbi:MAG: DUF4296 domain-containing protein [Bacteroidales bacterium]|nr:DUF4296 domain-containing protein [Bacteroidales bacterium]
MFQSCGNKKTIKGSEYIPREVLVQVISDMHIMDGITNDMIYYWKYNPIDSIVLFSSIYEKYDTSKDQYERTIGEYSKYPELLNEVYDEVLMNLNQKLDKIEAEDKEEKMAKRKISKHL